MKKVLVMILVVATMLTLCACGQTASKDAAAPAEDKTAASSDSASTIRSDLKEMLDSYEAFAEEYADFMKKYNANPTDTTLISQYSDFLTKYTDLAGKIEAVKEDTLTQDELKYYTVITTKVSKLLSDIGA